ncbi:hypothetical protein QP547_04550 [Weeksella virosa]|uniref:hypothetical protein n=1 Tax=Weeksella virosa TaxID=1014 RepID=UPI002556C079|nr:hypothetical protein [Weeksella virosa]MDK7675079.1 hypothetical protein [Weeksella virosa]
MASKIKETQFQWIFQSEDGNGEFEFRVHKNFSKIQLETGVEESYADTNLHEIIQIRDMLNLLLKQHENSSTPNQADSDGI